MSTERFKGRGKPRANSKLHRKPKPVGKESSPPKPEPATPQVLPGSQFVRYRSGRCALTADALFGIHAMLGVYAQELGQQINKPLPEKPDAAYMGRLASLRGELATIQKLASRARQTWPTNDLWACGLIADQMFGKCVIGPHSTQEVTLV